MKALFDHQNCPGQYRHLARQPGADPYNGVVFITQRKDATLPGVRKLINGDMGETLGPAMPRAIGLLSACACAVQSQEALAFFSYVADHFKRSIFGARQQTGPPSAPLSLYNHLTDESSRR